MGTLVIRGLRFFGAAVSSLTSTGSFASSFSSTVVSVTVFFRGRGMAMEEGGGRTLDVSVPRAIR
jgi:hypothetical protein